MIFAFACSKRLRIAYKAICFGPASFAKLLLFAATGRSNCRKSNYVDHKLQLVFIIPRFI